MTRHVFISAAVLFAFMLGHALLETARDALFLTTLGPERLAWAYIVIAAVALATVSVVRRRSRDPRRMLIGLLLGAGIGTAVLAMTLTLARSHASSLVFVLYVWTGVVASLVVPTFWLLVERLMIVSDAKRTFGWLTAGGGLGALVGSLLAAALGGLVPMQYSVGLAAVAFAGATWLATRVDAGALVARFARPTGRAMRVGTALRSQRYIRLLLVLALMSTIALTLGDLMFKRVLAANAGEDLATEIGAIYALLNLLALVVQLFVTSRLVERLGVGGALVVLPLVLLATTVGFLATGAAIAVIAMRLGDGTLRHSVHRVASEILYMPLTPAVREATKPLLEIIGQRGGQVLAALLALLVAHNGLGTWQLAAMLAVLVVTWLVIIAATRRAYVGQFRDMLAAGEIQRDARIPTLDGKAVNMLTAALSSPDEGEAMAALDLLARRGDRIPALVLYHPSPAIVRRALAAIDHGVRPDVVRVLSRLIEHPDPQIRAAALMASSRGGCHGERLLAALHDPEPDVRAAAALSVCDQDKARATIDELLAGTTDDRAALARAIAHRPVPAHRPLLEQLAARREPAVMREVVRVWEHHPELADVERLLRLLDDPHVRGDARRALVAGGAPSLARALEALDDPRTPLGVRRHLPRTISRFRTPAAAAALVARLVREPDGMTQFKILRALGRLRTDNPELPLDPVPVRVYARRSIEDAARYARLGDRLRQERAPTTPASELLGALLVEKRRYAIDRVFRSLGILYPNADMRSVHDAITSADDERAAAAGEILDGLVSADLRVPLVALLEAQNAPTPPIDMTYEDMLAALLEDPSDSLRCVAAHHIAERRLVALRRDLVRLKPSTVSPTVLSAFDQALARLDA